MRLAGGLASAVVLAPFQKQSMRLMNALWVSMQEVDIRVSPGKCVLLRRL
jgi:hypothetical protein